MVNSEQSLLKNLITTDERFARSVNLKFDFYDDSSLPDYKFTHKSVELLQDILDCASGKTRDRSWSIIGPYGSGKSIFSLLLVKLLCKSKSPWVDRSLDKLNLFAPDFLELIENHQADTDSGYIPVIVQGSNDSLDISLCSALLDSTYPKDNNHSWASEQFRDSIEIAIETLQTGISGSQLTIDVYKQAILLAKAQGYKGLVVAIDEFGKFLEKAAWQGSISEIISSQYLAEMASNSGDPELLYFTIQHQGMGNYMKSLNEQQSNEWAKIQGRFRPIEFTQDEDGLYQLIASSLSQAEGISPQHINDWKDRVWQQSKNIEYFNNSTNANAWPELLLSVYPLHPIALFALPRLSRNISQNERTLFSFIGSDDPLALKNFLAITVTSNGVLPSLTADYLYDFFVSGVSYLTLTPELQKVVAETENGLDRISDYNPFETRLVKTIGVIALLRSPIKATKETLIAGLDLKERGDLVKLTESLKNLMARKVIVYRRYSEEYRLWQGSDFDFDTHITAAREEIAEDLDIPSLIKQELDMQPVPARRHSIETGARRHFDIQFVTSNARIGPPDAEKAGDILYYLPSTEVEIEKALKNIKKVKDSHIIAVLPKEPVNVNELTLELAASRKVLRDQIELQDDPVALKEIAGRIQATEELLRDEIQEIIEPNVGRSNWYSGGKEKSISNRRHLQELLSNVCDDIYSKAPVVPNELINRLMLSGTMKRGLKLLIQGILAHPNEPDLALSGNGPEVSVYRAVIQKNGLHKTRKNQTATFVKPSKDTDRGIRSVWSLIERYLKTADKESKDFKTLYQLMSKPPYGVKGGLIPLFIWLVLQSNRSSISVFENGTFQTEWNFELLDRFIKSEENLDQAEDTFAIRWLGSKDVATNHLLRNLILSIPNCKEAKETTISAFLGSLYGWYAVLPTYSKHTYDLSENAKRLRSSITSASDPISLVFQILPSSLGVPKENRGDAKALNDSDYISLVKSTLIEIEDSYRALMDKIVVSMCHVFKCVVTEDSPASVDNLKNYFDSLDPSLMIFVRDPLVKAFLLRACTFEPDNQTWLESLASGLGNQPPKYWMDDNYEEFQDKLALIAMTLTDARKRQYAKESLLEQGDGSMMRILLDINGEEHLEEIYVDQGDSEEIERMVEKFSDQIENEFANIDITRRREILARVLGRLSGGRSG